MLGNLVVPLIIVGFILFFTVIWILRKGRISIKFAIIWLIPSFIIIILALFPNIFLIFASLFGFQTISNLVVGILFVLMFFIILALTVLIAGQTTKINLLIQEVSILKKEIKNDEK